MERNMDKIDLYRGDYSKREDDITYIATISGGKDSVTMCDLLLKNNYPVDYIVFSDTLFEFDEMYTYINKVNVHFQSRYKKEITFLKPDTTFESWCFGTLGRGKGKDRIRGLPLLTNPCYWRRESKVKPQEKFYSKFDKLVVYIGFAKEENRSVQNTDKITYKYPLKDYFRMSEENCKQYLINQEMENPLYKDFSRTGCSICPYQSEQSFFIIWKKYQKVWEDMKKIENKLNGSLNDFWFTDYKTCEDMEKMFKEKNKQGSLFDFSDEPLKDCFCKI